MELIKLVKLNLIMYAVSFKGEKENLSKFLEIVMYDENVHYNFYFNTWVIYKKNIKSFINRYPSLKIKAPMEKIKLKNSSQKENAYNENILDIGKLMKLQPYLYQKEAIYFGLTKQNALIILPCGSGKSPIGVGLCLEAYEKQLITGKCLILVKASLKYQWLKEVNKFSDLKTKIIETPSKAGKKKFINQFEDCDIYIANYETLLNKEVAKILLTKNIELIYADKICPFI